MTTTPEQYAHRLAANAGNPNAVAWILAQIQNEEAPVAMSTLSWMTVLLGQHLAAADRAGHPWRAAHAAHLAAMETNQ